MLKHFPRFAIIAFLLGGGTGLTACYRPYYRPEYDERRREEERIRRDEAIRRQEHHDYPR